VFNRGLSSGDKNETIHPQSSKNTSSSSHAKVLISQPACTPLAPTNPGTFWFENINHNGLAPFILDSGPYSVFRNVKDFGVKGDGVTDDSAAIQAAINGKICFHLNPRLDWLTFFLSWKFGNRQDTEYARLWFNRWTSRHLRSSRQICFGKSHSALYKHVCGNPNNRPQLLASSRFNENTMVYGKDPNQSATDNFCIGIKNMIFVSISASASTAFTLLDWSVPQATHITNIKFDMPDNSQHTGMAMPEGGSGTIMGNLPFTGGKYGINMNNQQYLIKDTTFDGCNTAIFISHVLIWWYRMSHSRIVKLG
jgi:glucan 1,3-beta-glucosidase